MFILFDGKNVCRVVIAEGVPAQASYAAEQLRCYIGLMTGVSPTVEKGTDACGAITLTAGDDGLGEDGYAIAADKDGVTLSGGRRGVIYAAYALLEKLGCRFFAVDCEKVPVWNAIMTEDTRERVVPALEYREHNYVPLRKSPRFSVKCRLNGKSHAIGEAMGGHIDYAWFVHTVEQMVPPDDYAQTHPEYFALWQGKRQTQKHTGQLCLSNPGTLAVAIENVRKALRANPGAHIISLSQNDFNGNYCQCDACRAVDAEEGSPSGTLIRFVNAVAEALEPEFPDVVFDTLAYNYTRSAPRVTRPRHNVCVRLCSIECCFAHPFETCDDESRRLTHPDGHKTSFMEDLESWGRVSRRNYIWDYTTCFAHYPTPHPNWNSLQPNMRAFVRNGVRGVFEQANGAQGGGADLNEMRAYVISKLLWDADTDVEKHIREFTDFYYGAAGAFVREYIRALTEKAERDDIHVGFNDNPKSELFSDDMLDTLEAILRKAADAVRGDPVRMMRVDEIALCPRYVRLRRNIMLKGEKDIGQINRFMQDWRAHGLTRMEEWFSRESSVRSMLDGKWRSVDYFAVWTDETPEIP